MYKRTLLIFPLLIGIMMGSSVENDNYNANSIKNPLVGSWRQLGECQSNTATETSIDAYIIFTNNIAAITIKKFQGIECDNNQLIDHKVITYQYSSTESDSRTSGNELDFTLIDVSNRKGNPSKAYVDTYAGFSVVENRLYIVDKEERSSEDVTNIFDGNTYWVKQ